MSHIQTTESAPGLDRLSSVALNDAHEHAWKMASSMSLGSPRWKERKLAELRDVLALSQIAPPGRLSVEGIELFVDLCLKLRLAVPVPCMPADGSGRLLVARYAIVHLRYPQLAVSMPMPGTSFLRIEEPRNIWHANVSPSGRPLPHGVFCAGATVSAGTRVSELILTLYYGLCMNPHAVQIDEQDPAGVLNGEAAVWWQHNRDRIPLSEQPFLEPDPSKEAHS